MRNLKNLQKEIIRQANNELCRRNVWDFCLHYDFNFFSKHPYLKIIANSAQWTIQKSDTPEHVINYVKKEVTENDHCTWLGEAPNKIGVFLPPRGGKSYVLSVVTAWTLAKYPEDSVMRNACTYKLFNKFSYDVRAIIRTVRFKEIFPDIFLSKDKQDVSGWNLTKAKQVSYFGAGVGGTIIGFGASKLAITDDLYKSMEDALSPNTIEKVESWKESAHNTRLERNCAEIDIGTRWSTKDILGKSEKEGEYDIIIRIPALIKGKSFCEEVKTTKEYKKIKKKVSSGMWSAGYQQKPAEIKGAAFPVSKMKRFKMSQINRFDYIVVNYTDVADQGTDFLCSLYCAILKKKLYLVDVTYTQEDSNYTIPQAKNKIKKWKVKKAVYESNNQGLMYTKLLKENLKKKYRDYITAIPNSKNKHSRIVIQSDWIVKNMYILEDSEIEENEEYQLYLEHLGDYLKQKASIPDDAPDASAGMSKLAQDII